MTMLVVEDETAATVNLLSIIAEVCPDCRVMATLESVSDTVRWLQSNPAPDVIFLDIHLADGDAFRIFDKIEVLSPVIFTTAYDHYALEAFRVNSIDYLLKPIRSEDLDRAIDKLLRLTRSGAVGEYFDQIGQMAAAQNKQSGALLVRLRDKIIPVIPSDVAYFYTSQERVTLHTFDGRSLPLDKTLDALMATLPEQSFFRANRQFIICREAIRDISVWFGSRMNINLMIPPPERIIISKARVPLFKRWLMGES